MGNNLSKAQIFLGMTPKPPSKTPSQNRRNGAVPSVSGSCLSMEKRIYKVNSYRCLAIQHKFPEGADELYHIILYHICGDKSILFSRTLYASII